MSCYEFYWSQEWAIKHEKSLNKPKRYDCKDDVAIKELFDELDENHSEYGDLMRMMKKLHINPIRSSLPEFFGFLGGYVKESMNLDEFRDIITSNRYRHRLYDEKESINSYNELIELVNSLRRYNLKVNLMNSEDVRESVDIYKQLFVLPKYYQEMYTNKNEIEMNNTDVWLKLRIAIMDLHKTNERIKYNQKMNIMNKIKNKTSYDNHNNNNNNNTTMKRENMKNEIEKNDNKSKISLPSINRHIGITETEEKEEKEEKEESNLNSTNLKRVMMKKKKKKNKENNVKCISVQPSILRKRIGKYFEVNDEGEIKNKKDSYM